ncbi:uncharacterized protein [Atheta coriaria]|uniref:uncharacterized protein isoform X2 n=1 Tax=Dalotia coriaria TaxID=877792 RepID=UPI0031F4000B
MVPQAAILCALVALTQAAYFHRPKYLITAMRFTLGGYHGSLEIGSDYPMGHMHGIPSVAQLRSVLNVPDETKHQLQMITKDILETFGLYEPFRKQTKAMVVNNPVYYGNGSGMVNYHKNLYDKKKDVPESTQTSYYKWQGLNSTDNDTMDNWAGVVTDAHIP